MEKLFALVDCNTFYVSCERVFNPKLRGAPVIVMSNNDGCAVARSEEAKELGIPMGAPVFMYQDVLKKHKVEMLSSNYNFYADMSQRVISTLSRFSPEMEIYSIDEAFLDFSGFNNINLTEYAKDIKTTVYKWTGIPISIGIAPTKTLAKIANKLAKKNSMCNGVLDITDHPRLDDFLQSVHVEDVWGVGRQYTKLLMRNRILTALDLKKASDVWVKKHMTIVGLRTVLELRGIPCIELDEVHEPKQQIIRSRSFGKSITNSTGAKRSSCFPYNPCSRKAKRIKINCILYKCIYRNKPFQNRRTTILEYRRLPSAGAYGIHTIADQICSTMPGKNIQGGF